MKTSLVIPFRNEKENAENTIFVLNEYLEGSGIDFELVVVDDSTDGTWEILQSIAKRLSSIVLVRGSTPPGYGKALRMGFGMATGDILIPFNGDLSDSPRDVVTYVRYIELGYDMVVGSRWSTVNANRGVGGGKRLVSRAGNEFLKVLFKVRCNDITNSFKAYRREVIDAVQPKADGFDISMELFLKGARKGFKYVSVPVSWVDREFGQSKMSVVKAMTAYLSMAARIRFSA